MSQYLKNLEKALAEFDVFCTQHFSKNILEDMPDIAAAQNMLPEIKLNYEQ